MNHDGCGLGPTGSDEIGLKTVKLTGKEIARADGGVTVVVRPQSSGGYLVMAVRLTGDVTGVPMGKVFTEAVETKAGVPGAAREVCRWLSKLGVPCTMADASRVRARRPANGAPACTEQIALEGFERRLVPLAMPERTRSCVDTGGAATC